MRVLFISGALRTTGETRIALTLADALKRHGDQADCMVFPLGAELAAALDYRPVVLGEERASNVRLLRERVRMDRPDLIILADYHLFATAEVAARLALDDLADLSTPIFSLDCVGLAPAEQELYWQPLRVTRAIPAMPDFIRAAIKPCPPSDPGRNQPRCACVRLYDSMPTLPSDERLALRRSLGCADGPMVFFSAPRWVYQLAGNSPAIYAYYMFLGEILARHLSGLAKPLHLVLVSPRQLLAGADNSLETHWLRPSGGKHVLPDAQYCALALAADLTLTDNILANTLSLAVMGLVPAACLVNTLNITEDGTQTQVDAAFPLTAWGRNLTQRMRRCAPDSVFPCAWFPYGMWPEIQRWHEGNPYLQAIRQLELFDDVGTRAALADLLAGGLEAQALRASRQRYAESALALPSLPALLRQLM